MACLCRYCRGGAGCAPAPLARPLPALRAPQQLASLSVRWPNLVTLSKALCRRVPQLRAGAPVELVPPLRRGGTWHLDTRPTAGRRLSARPGEAARFRGGYALGPEHFLEPAVAARKGQKGGAQGTAGHSTRRVFVLGAEVPGHPGYYTLHPLRLEPPNGSAQ